MKRIIFILDLENLSQFNKRLFKKYLGIYISQRRADLKISLTQASSAALISEKEFKSIEAGQTKLSQNLFDRLCFAFDLDPQEIVNIGKVTQVQHILEVCKELDELTP